MYIIGLFGLRTPYKIVLQDEFLNFVRTFYKTWCLVIKLTVYGMRIRFIHVSVRYRLAIINQNK